MFLKPEGIYTNSQVLMQHVDTEQSHKHLQRALHSDYPDISPDLTNRMLSVSAC